MDLHQAERNIHRHSFTLVFVPSVNQQSVWNLEVEFWKLQVAAISFFIILTFSLFINKYSPSFIQTLSSYQVATLEQKEYKQKLEDAISYSIVLKDRLRELRSRELNLRDLLSLSPRSRLTTKKDDYSDLPVVTTQKIISTRGEYGKVLVDDKPLLEFFGQGGGAGQRATQAAERMKDFMIIAKDPKKIKLVPYAQNMDEVGIEYNTLELFRVTKADASQFNTTPYLLAQKWRDDMIAALDIGKKDRLSTKILSFVQGIVAKRRETQYRKLEAFFSEIDYPVQTVSGVWQANDPRLQKVSHMINFIKHESSTRQNSYNDLASTIQTYKARFAVTPSQSPVPFSFVLSNFGWRYHPITRRLTFHAGVDLPTFHGAPVYATAAGKVCRQGWFGGYGWTVEIDHGFGIKTLYAHNAQLVTYAGQMIQKGQIIARAGSSGLATGVHSHYEVRLNDHATNPMRFINLDIFTACKYW